MRRTQEELKIERISFKIYQENEGQWVGFRICPKCENEINHSGKEVCTLTRNIRNANNENTLCLKCSVTGENNPFFNKKHSNETKAKVSKSRTGKACGENNAMANPENRNKVSAGLRDGYDSGRLDYVREINKNRAIEGHKKGIYNTSSISKQETKLKNLFEEIGYKTKSQFLINTLKYDLFLEEHNTLIEYNGDYWHCNPEKYKSDYFNQKKNKFAYELWENDKNKKELAIKNGYKFFVIWEKNFSKNNQEEINKIISQL